ncbi:glycosyltransferase family 2 protein [Micromonospora zhanjiangensis]
MTPVRGRVPELRAMLASVRVAAARCPVPVEVIVVDDSEPHQARQHRDSCRRYGARYLRGPRNVGAKRNIGVRDSRYDVVVFLDSDCRATADLLGRYAAGIDRADADVAAIAGPTFPEPGTGPVFRLMRGSALLNDDLERPARLHRVPWATTCNLAVRRSAFEEVGGFRTDTLDLVGGEDVDFGLRLTGRGFVIACDPQAVVTHASGSTGSLPTVLRRLWTYGRSEQWLVTRHPLGRRTRLNPVTATVVASLVALLGAHSSRRALWLGPATAAALLVRDAHRRGGLTPPLVARTLVEWAFDAGAVSGAVRLRRPDLLLAGFAPADIVPDNPRRAHVG